MLEALDDDASWVSAADQERIFGALLPFVIFHDKKQLINHYVSISKQYGKLPLKSKCLIMRHFLDQLLNITNFFTNGL
ncbi:hypothetical protein ACFQDN_23350 [Pseudomonas asuensis]|uniref:hypothetical protein n=1 Tax=Pseudomonas asuensis TaxID=1825787 RepID=UPI00166A655B|nr:hypothetical protein [Pseudomonas asuensis]